MKAKEKKGAAIILITIVALIVIAILTGFKVQKPKVHTEKYTVCKGDTLYSIAESYKIKNWRKWSYDVRLLNGMESCMIYPGDEIVVIIND